MKTIKKVEYQNNLRKLYHDLEDAERCADNKIKKKAEKIKLIHQDWACKIPEIRIKFLPDFETLKKPGFGYIRELIHRFIYLLLPLTSIPNRQLHLVIKANHRRRFISQSLPLSSIQRVHASSRRH
jgi:hypothetical protein